MKYCTYGDERSLVNLGSFDDIIHCPTNDSNLTISVSWKLSQKLAIEDIGKVNTLSFLLGISMGALEAFRYVVGGGHFEVNPASFPAGYDIVTPNWEDRVQSLFRCYGNSQHIIGRS